MGRNVFLCIFTFYCQAALTVALMCPSGYWPYPCSMCLRVSASNEVQSFDTAETECQSVNGALARFSDSNQFETLRRYIRVLGTTGSAYWVGYQYNTGGTPVDANNQMVAQQESDILNDMNNFVSGEAAGDGVCVAINSEGLLQNVACVMPMSYICANAYSAPNVTITANSSSPVSEGSAVRIDCTASGDGVNRTVLRRNREEVTDGVTSATLTIPVFTVDQHAGTYDCLVPNPIGMALSQGLRLDTSNSPGSAPVISSLESSPSSSPIVLGSTVTLTCTFDSQNSVSWFVNGLELTDSDNITITTGATNSMLRIDAFHQPGVYQCRVSSSNSVSPVESLVLCGGDGLPGPVDFLFAIPETQNSINVSWIPPVFTNTSDPLLLRYIILSHNTSNDLFSFDLAVETEVEPSANSDLVSTILTGLEVGTKYAVAIRAQSSAGNGSNPERYVIVSTYGRPPSRVQNLTVSRTPSNNTLVAFWLRIVSTPPTGQVVRYEIQYRNLGQNITNSRLQPSTFGYTVIDNVVNASSYEVRVRASVEVQRDPVMYGHSEWTNWEPVSSVINPTDVPSVPPSTGVVPTNAARIAAAVVPVVVVVAIVVLVFLAACVYRSVYKNKRPTEEDRPTEKEHSLDDKPTSNDYYEPAT